MTNNFKRQQPDSTSASSISSRTGMRERNGLIGRTSLPLPSLSDLGQLSSAFASEQTEKDVVFPDKNKEEPLLFLSEFSTILQPPVSPPGVAIEPARPALVATALPAKPLMESAGPDEPTEPLIVALGPDEPTKPLMVPAGPDELTQPVQLAVALPARSDEPTQPLPTNQPAGQQRAAIKRVRLRSLLLIGAICLLAGGGLWYAIAHFMTPVTLSTPVQSQRAVVQNRGTIAPQPVSRSFQVGSDPTITIQGHTGVVHIVAGSPHIVIVKTSSNQGAASASNGIRYNQALDAQGNAVLSIIAPAAGNVTYDVAVPSAAHVRIILDSAAITVNGISGVTIAITNGSLDIEHISGPLHASTKNGDIIVRNVTGRMVVQTENGSIRASDITGPLQATTHNGDVNVQRGALSGQSFLKTVYGSVSFVGTLNRQGNYTLETSRGNVTLTLPEGAAFQLHTHIGSGNIHNAFGKTTAGTSPRPQLIINVDSGSIQLNRAIS